MEEYIHYITNIAVDAERPLRPVYGIVPTEPLEERIAPDLDGLPGLRAPCASATRPPSSCSTTPTAASSSAPRRCSSTSGCRAWAMRPCSGASSRSGMQARRFALEPDAGPWEYRGRQRVHTHSATMCWVACDRLARIAARLGLPTAPRIGAGKPTRCASEILQRAWNERRGAIAGALDDDELDASVLLLPELGLLPANDERFVRTCARDRQGAQPQRLHHALYRRGRFRRCRRRHFSSASSGTSTRWWRSDARKRRASCSPTC